MLNCAICGKPLERKDRKGDGYVHIERLDDKENTVWEDGFNSMY